MAVINSKKENYAYYDRGMFGNRLLTWGNLEDYYNSDYSLPVVMRYKGPVAGKWCIYGLTREEVPKIASQWQAEGADPKLIVLNELANDANLILQGEVMRSTRYFDLTYSTVPKPMRLALKEKTQHAHGLNAKLLIESAMDHYSYIQLQELFDQFPDSIIEFSIWGSDVGDFNCRNTVFWEVRNY